MKNLFAFKKITIISILTLSLFGCKLDDGGTLPVPESNLAELIQADPNLSLLNEALERAELITALSGTSPLTVLAPTDGAFTSFLSTKGFASVNQVPVPTLRQILLNHVFNNRIDSSVLINLKRNYLETLADGPATDAKLFMYFDASNDIIFNGVSKVTSRDKLASNGIYHVVDNVLDLPTIETFISIDENFKTFDTALDLISPVSDLPLMLKESSSGPFTLFVPTKQAFDALLESNSEWQFVSDIEENVLSAVISHHVLEGNIKLSTLNSGQTYATLEGDEITLVNVNGDLGITDGSGNTGSFVQIANIQATNGIIQILADKVLLPDTSN